MVSDKRKKASRESKKAASPCGSVGIPKKTSVAFKPDTAAKKGPKTAYLFLQDASQFASGFLTDSRTLTKAQRSGLELQDQTPTSERYQVPKGPLKRVKYSM